MYKSIQQFCESGIINLDNICAGFFEDPENIAGFVNGVHYEQLEGGKDPSSEESGSDREQHRRTHQPCTGEQDELKATWLVQDRSRPEGGENCEHTTGTKGICWNWSDTRSRCGRKTKRKRKYTRQRYCEAAASSKPKFKGALESANRNDSCS